MFPTKIVLTTDGSEEARRVAGLAVNLAEGLDSELHLVHVEPVPSVYTLPNPRSTTRISATRCARRQSARLAKGSTQR